MNLRLVPLLLILSLAACAKSEAPVAVGDAPAVVLAYGKFIQSVIDFIIVAFAIFMGVKAINRLKREEAVAPSAPPVPTKEEELLGEIRDLLKVQNNRP